MIYLINTLKTSLNLMHPEPSSYCTPKNAVPTNQSINQLIGYILSVNHEPTARSDRIPDPGHGPSHSTLDLGFRANDFKREPHAII